MLSSTNSRNLILHSYQTQLTKKKKKGKCMTINKASIYFYVCSSDMSLFFIAFYISSILLGSVNRFITLSVVHLNFIDTCVIITFVTVYMIVKL